MTVVRPRSHRPVASGQASSPCTRTDRPAYAWLPSTAGVCGRALALTIRCGVSRRRGDASVIGADALKPTKPMSTGNEKERPQEPGGVTDTDQVSRAGLTRP